MNVSKHRKEGREDGRTPLPREMCSAVLVHITHTYIEIIHGKAFSALQSYLARWCDEIPYPVNPRSSDSDRPSWVLSLLHSYSRS